MSWRRQPGYPAAASFKHVSPAGAAIGLPLSETLKKDLLCRRPGADADRLPPTPERGAPTGCPPYGDWVALSEPCDKATATLLAREVSDGIIAPGYTDEALEILKSKRKGGYNVVRIDPAYTPAAVEHKQVYGVTFEQGRNDLKIDASMLENFVTDVSAFPEEAKLDLVIALITLKYTQSNSVCYAKGRAGHRHWCRPAVEDSLHPPRREQG